MPEAQRKLLRKRVPPQPQGGAERTCARLDSPGDPGCSCCSCRPQKAPALARRQDQAAQHVYPHPPRAASRPDARQSRSTALTLQNGTQAGIEGLRQLISASVWAGPLDELLCQSSETCNRDTQKSGNAHVGQRTWQPLPCCPAREPVGHTFPRPGSVLVVAVVDRPT